MPTIALLPSSAAAAAAAVRMPLTQQRLRPVVLVLVLLPVVQGPAARSICAPSSSAPRFLRPPRPSAAATAKAGGSDRAAAGVPLGAVVPPQAVAVRGG